jgi:tetratricopeptide (TPR) repeat protein
MYPESDEISKDTIQRITLFRQQYVTVANKTLDLVEDKLSSPSELKRGMGLLFNQLKLMSNISECHQVFVTIVSTLNDWPLRFGYSSIWHIYVEHAYDLALTYDIQEHKNRLLLLKSETAFYREKMNEALELGLQALDEAQVLGQTDVLARSAHHVVNLLINKTNFLDAYELVKSIDKTGLINKESNAVAQLYIAISYFEVYQKLGKVNETQILITDVEDSLITKVDNHSRATWHHIVGLFEWRLGNHRDALKRYEVSRQLFAETGDYFEIALMSEMSLAWWTMGRLREAEALLLSARDLADQTLNYFRSFKASSNLALVYLSMGRVREAYNLNQECLDKAIATDYSRDIIRLTGNRGLIMAYLDKPNYTEALHDLKLDQQYFSARTQYLSSIYAHLSHLHNQLGDSKLAYTYAQDAFLIAYEKGYRQFEIIALRALAECTPSKAHAITILNRAITLAQDHALLHEAACYLSLSSLLTEPEQQEEYWDRGSQLLQQIGAERWLENSSISSPPLIPVAG